MTERLPDEVKKIAEIISESCIRKDCKNISCAECYAEELYNVGYRNVSQVSLEKLEEEIRDYLIELGSNWGDYVADMKKKPITYNEATEKLSNLIKPLILSEREKANKEEREIREQLIKSLKEVTEHYIALVNSGDCGFWNPEKEDEIIQARQALKESE